MRSATTAEDALELGRDVLALARVALSAGEAIDVDEIRWAIRRAMVSLLALGALSPATASASREVLDRLSDVLAELGSRTCGGTAEK